MSEENLNEQSVSQQETVDDATNYIEAIKEMKRNSVSKADYEKLQAENRQLLDSLINGNQVEMINPEPPVDINELRNDLFNKDNTNLSFIEKSLKLRDALIKSGQPDIFLPIGKQIAPTDEDIAKAQKVADALSDCVEYADGNSEIFTQELQRIMVDSAPQLRFRRR